MRYLAVVLLTLVLTVSCNEYQKVLKSEDAKLKYDLAEKFYNEGDFRRANRLFEQIAPQYIGKPQGERIIFMYANSFYQIRDYYTGGYQFERFAKSYPRSEKVEEAAFLAAKCLNLSSPKYSIDQTETHKAIEKLQLYINQYPTSENLPEANKMAQELSEKLQRKEYEIAKQYNTTRNYESSVTSFNNFLLDFPGSIYREDAMFYRFDSAYRLAINSVSYKIEERLLEAEGHYNNLKKYYPQTKYADKADAMKAEIEEQLKTVTSK